MKRSQVFCLYNCLDHLFYYLVPMVLESDDDDKENDAVVEQVSVMQFISISGGN